MKTAQEDAHELSLWIGTSNWTSESYVAELTTRLQAIKAEAMREGMEKALQLAREVTADLEIDGDDEAAEIIWSIMRALPATKPEEL